MHVATYKAFVDELEKIAASYVPLGVAETAHRLNILKAAPRAASSVFKAVGEHAGTAVEGARRAAPAAAGAVAGAAKKVPGWGAAAMGKLKALRKPAAVIGTAGAVGVGAGAAGEHAMHKNKQDQTGYAIPG